MLEFKMDLTNYPWVKYKAQDFQSQPTLDGYRMRINGEVFDKWSEKLEKVFNKELMWEKLNND